jgi:hypothetical protein
MNRLAVWVAQTAVSATVPMALAQATDSPLPEMAAYAGLDADIAAPPLVAIDLIHGLEGRARGALVQRARYASASNALTVHPVTAANDSRIPDTRISARRPVQSGKAAAEWRPSSLLEDAVSRRRFRRRNARQPTKWVMTVGRSGPMNPRPKGR